MTSNPLAIPTDPKAVTLAALARLRVAFPLQARLLAAPQAVRVMYAQILSYWLRATAPPVSAFDSAMLGVLVQLDAVVQEEQTLDCYPFSTTDTGMRVTWPAGTASARGAIDALAIARRVRADTRIDAACRACGAGIECRVQENGGLDHDQVEVARVVWLSGQATDASRREIYFLCRSCTPPPACECFSLPQASAIGNAFYGFQAALLAAHVGRAA